MNMLSICCVPLRVTGKNIGERQLIAATIESESKSRAFLGLLAIPSEYFKPCKHNSDTCYYQLM